MKFNEPERPTVALTDWPSIAVAALAEGKPDSARSAIDRYLERADPRQLSRLLIDAALRGGPDDHRLLHIVADAVDEPELKLSARVASAVQRTRPTK